MASTIIQVYLQQLLEAFFHTDAQVRMTALNVIELVLKQGLVHPVQVSITVDLFAIVSGSKVHCTTCIVVCAVLYSLHNMCPLFLCPDCTVSNSHGL